MPKLVMLQLTISKGESELKKIFIISTLFLLIFLTGCDSTMIQEEETGNAANIVLQEAVLNDALAVSEAANLYCAVNVCGAIEELTWLQLSPYVATIDESDYDFTAYNGFVAKIESTGIKVYLERSGTGDYEFIEGGIPRESTTVDVIIDTN